MLSGNGQNPCLVQNKFQIDQRFNVKNETVTARKSFDRSREYFPKYEIKFRSHKIKNGKIDY